MSADEPRSPLDLLGALAVEDAECDGFAHLEIYTLKGLLTLLWHGPRDARDVVVTCGGGMGSLLGPARALYQRLGDELGREGTGVVRVGYRTPNDLGRCMHDVVAAGDLARRHGEIGRAHV